MSADKHKQLWYLQSMGIQSYALKDNDKMGVHAEDEMTWEYLQAQVQNCQKCPLHKSRTQTVFGVGSKTANLVLVGEAPGREEDLKGEPFVGRAGKLLDEMLKAINLSRETIYIANILKCRPPNNRDPNGEEQATCAPYLEQQLAFLQPKLIVALGRISAQYLLKSDLSLGRLRNQMHSFGKTQTPLLVTYHPAYLLRRPSDKAKAWADLLQIKNLLASE